ncbi:hypothetical protein BD779DRAFT_1578431, partial [Infundibulicybe gibba]
MELICWVVKERGLGYTAEPTHQHISSVFKDFYCVSEAICFKRRKHCVQFLEKAFMRSRQCSLAI